MVTKRLLQLDRPAFWIAAGAIIAATPRSGGGHDELEGQIALVTERIEKDPANAALYLERSDLHRQHQEWDAAMADVELACGLDPGLPEVLLCRGRVLVDAGWPRAARTVLDRFLAARPGDAEALLARARALAALGEHLEAAGDFGRAIARLPRPRAEHYIERARALAAAGGKHAGEALECLDEGITRLGPAVPLELYALELELEGKRYEAALERIDALAAGSRRDEKWLARRGEVLEQAGRREEAREAYTRALGAIRALPLDRRRTREITEIERSLRAALERLVVPEPGG